MTTPDRPVDLRSDTVTRPTRGMLAAMLAAEVGDDVFGEDPTVRALEERTAALFGKEAGLFVPSGTMANQIAVRVHCRPQDEILLEATSHVYLWEAGGPAALSGVTCRPITAERGQLRLEHLSEAIRPDDYHYVRTRLLCLENTHNRGGGTIYPVAELARLAEWARQHGLAVHVDGARIWNAMVATGVPAPRWGQYCDTLAVCFSKGLGAPVGSLLVGRREQIAEARRYRKLFGGGMRQAGYLAAACLYALEHHVERLAEDHAHAQQLAEAIAVVPGLCLTPPQVQTNLIWFEARPPWSSAQAVAEQLRQRGVLVAVLGPRLLRAVTHLDVSAADCRYAAEIF
ncbi:MAG: low-specificity L-threonine aldolase, partial [Gemmataceae bacterium]|nr:low-specificity L-threonine aldolase [Gemmataceae bacterium]